MSAVIFTDLDGTLLDHHDYSLDAACPALEAVKRNAIPLLLATSKTLAEAIDLNRSLDNNETVIVENGGAICVPVDHNLPLLQDDASDEQHGHRILRFSPGYDEIRRFIEVQRDTYGYRLRGFGDMTVLDIVDCTSLSLIAAERARQRLCSEPFLWDDTGERLEQLREKAAKAGLQLTRGGRFYHLMGHTNKARAMLFLLEMMQKIQARKLSSIALGDSENDREMLQCADIAVVVRRHDGTQLDCRGRQQTIFTQQAGPAGWNAAVLQVLKQLDAAEPAATGG